jgi:ABC-2 type transport system permease protein
MKALAIAGVDLRRLMRWRPNIFFLFVLPMLIILLLGAAFGGSQTARIGVLSRSSDPLAQQFVTALGHRPATTVVRYTSVGKLRDDVAHGNLDAGLVIPADYDARLAHGTNMLLSYFGRPNSGAQQLRATVQSVAADQGRAIAAAQVLEQTLGTSFPVALAQARATAAHIPLAPVKRGTDPNQRLRHQPNLQPRGST